MQFEQVLVESACEGHTDAIEELLRQCQPSVTQFARKYCATPQDVEDAVQQTLWLIYRKINTLKSTQAFVSWIFTIVRNQCYRLLARYHAVDTVEVSKLDLLAMGGESDLYDALKVDVVSAIAQLPTIYREVLIMRDIQGYSTPEVAERLNLSSAAVKSRLHRARNLLRDMLQHWADEA